MEKSAAIIRPDYAGIAGQIAEQNRQIAKLIQVANSAAKHTIDRVIKVGEMLLDIRKKLSGEFDAWLEAYHATKEDFPARATCYNYMRAVRYKQTLDEESPDPSSVKELFVAAGILPAPKRPEDDHSSSPPIFRIKFAISAPDPEKWEPGDRREFLRQAKPVVELYEKIKAAEAA